MDTTKEAALVRDAFQGDGAAFGKIVARYEKPVFNLCARYLPVADAEDIAQETFVRAFVYRERFDPSRPLLPWLFTIGRRLSIDKLRNRKGVAESGAERIELRDPAASADDIVSAKEELAILAKAIEALPEGQREAIIQHHVEGLTYQEVADVLDVPIGTVMTWLHRGRAKLQALFKSLSRDPKRDEELEETRERIG